MSPKKEKKRVPVRSAHRAQAPKYRFLRHGEIKRKGDQFKDCCGKWKPVFYVGAPHDDGDEPVRRPVARSARRSAAKPEQSQRNPKVTPTPKPNRRAQP